MTKKIKVKEAQSRYESFPEYKEGHDEYQKSGNKTMKCPDSPYEQDRKTAWLVGWLDARTESIFGKAAFCTTNGNC